MIRTQRRDIARVVRKARLGQVDEAADRRAYWARQPIEAQIAEVEALRRLWIEVTGDPDRPIGKIVHKRRLGAPAPKRPG
jgi:hypothetical protein